MTKKEPWWRLFFILDKNLSKKEKIHMGIIYFLHMTLIISSILFALNGRWFAFFVSLFTFLLLFIPEIIQRKYRIKFPVVFELMIVLFIYATLFLGEARRYYTYYWWWDTILHAFSGLALGFAGFLILFSLFKSYRVSAPPFLIALFAFSFSLAMGGLWEIFEFVLDSTVPTVELYGEAFQKDLRDTMWDLIADAAGALITSFLGYLYIKNGNSPLVGSSMDEFVKKNPRFFKKARGRKNL